MAGSVSVERTAVAAGIGCCKTAILSLKSAASDLKNKYQAAGASGWDDSKYAALGGIVNECCKNLMEPVSELNDCIGALDDLLKAIDEYEGNRL